jgi:phenylalanyl-tRNA synthetase beta chain
MKLSTSWVKEWAPLRAGADKIAEKLTLAGLETLAEPAGETLSDTVVVGLIREVKPHPNADKLRVCSVDAGGGKALSIVCGAPNARAGMKAPVALPGTKLPNGTEIRVAPLRGVESQGMLCSPSELELGEKSDGLLELDAGAKVGATLNACLGLDDHVLNLELTPNRGDCLSVAGLARELGASFGASVTPPRRGKVAVTAKDARAVRIRSRADCPRYAGRHVTGVDAAARTPDWMRERLRRSGLRPISAIVDITNYVMLELGQPLHAFDAAKLHGAVEVRRARAGETLKLLNDQTITLSADDLVIADEQAALALAGVMGGASSEVSSATTGVFLESACFKPETVAATGRRLRINSDAVYRFERGVDPALQRDALERATELILAICGGAAGPVTEALGLKAKPVRIRLRRARLDRVLGYEVAGGEVERLLKRLGLVVKRAAAGWQVGVPSFRYDLRIEDDLVEEVARLDGYEHIPLRPYAAELAPVPATELRRGVAWAQERMNARGWHEVVTYSFVEDKLQKQLAPAAKAVPLDNPIADTMSVMRTTLWSGLLPALQYNLNRQHRRVRIFETGVCFGEPAGKLVETFRIGGIAIGAAAPEQWGEAARAADFHDVKADLESLLAPSLAEYRFVKATHPALHPGQSAQVFRGPAAAGWVGALHPGLVRSLDLPGAPVLFELDWEIIAGVALPKGASPPEHPGVRRDLSFVVKEEVEAAQVLEHATAAGGTQLRQAFPFALYRGTGLPNGFKSMTLGLIFQADSRTLTDQEVDAAVEAIAQRVTARLGATLRTQGGSPGE